MELQYQKAMEENDLQLSDLPEDAITGIENINDVLKAVKMLEKSGKLPTPKTMKKLKAMDKWVYYEILDHLHGTDQNEDEIPEDSEDIVDEIEEQSSKGLAEANKINESSVFIEGQLESMMKSGKTTWSFNEIKQHAKKTWDVLFSSYEEGGENGIKTNKYSLIETEEHIFTLKTN